MLGSARACSTFAPITDDTNNLCGVVGAHKQGDNFYVANARVCGEWGLPRAMSLLSGCSVTMTTCALAYVCFASISMHMHVHIFARICVPYLSIPISRPSNSASRNTHTHTGTLPS